MEETTQMESVEPTVESVEPESVEDVQEIVEEEPTEPEQKKKKPETPIQFSLTDEQRKVLRHVLAVMKDLDISDVAFHYNGNLTFRQMNSSRVAMLIATIDLGRGLDVSSETIRTFTVDIDGFAKALKLSNPNIEVNEAEVLFHGDVGYTTRKAKVQIPLLESEEEQLPEPKLTLEVETDLDLEDIAKAVNVLVEEPSHLTFRSEDGNLSVRGENDKEQKIELNGFQSKGKGKASFSYNLIKALGKESWKLQYSTDMPMKATRTVTQTHYDRNGSSKTPIAQITVWIAPRIETD